MHEKVLIKLYNFFTDSEFIASRKTAMQIFQLQFHQVEKSSLVQVPTLKVGYNIIPAA